MAIDISIYYPLIFLISFVIMLFVIITFFISKVFKVTELDAYLNLELNELINSFLIMIFAIAFFISADAIAIGLVADYLPGQTILNQNTAGLRATDVASIIIQKNAIDVQNGMEDVFTIQVCLSILNTLQRRLGEQVLTITYKLFPAIDSIVSIMNIVGYGLVTVLTSLKAQLILMDFVNGTMGAFFLPAGIILRFFPPTREAGVFLIALAIGFQVIFPLVYVINERVTQDLYAADNNSFAVFKGYQSPKFLISMFCGLQYFVYGFIASPGVPTSFGGLGTTAIGQGLRNVFSEYRINVFQIELWLVPILNSMAYLSLPAFFLPSFAISITFAFVNAFIKFLLARM